MLPCLMREATAYCSSARPAQTTLLCTPVSSGSFAVPARQRRRSQRPCTKLYGICAHVERCILVATHCGLARLSPAALMSHYLAAGSPQLQWLGCRDGAGPRRKHPHASLALGVGWAEAPVVARCFHMYNLSKTCFNTLRRKTFGRTPGITPQSQARRTRC